MTKTTFRNEYAENNMKYSLNPFMWDTKVALKFTAQVKVDATIKNKSKPKIKRFSLLFININPKLIRPMSQSKSGYAKNTFKAGETLKLFQYKNIYRR